MATAAALACSAGQALAQTTAPTAPTAPAAPATQKLEEIVVTGTAIRGVAPVGSATVNMSREQILATPARTPSDLITQLPQGSGLGTTLTSSGGRSSGVNLRGLGNNATLLLFDGHRTVPQGVVGQVADPNIIPFSSLQRVEVVTDGASAIYGSDAVAGVVNYILRKDYDGAEITARYTHSLYDAYVADGVVGHKWSTGSIMLAAGWQNNTNVKNDARGYLMQDLRPYGGNDNRFVGTTVYPGLVSDLIVGTTVYGLPATNGAVPTAAQVLALKNNPNLYDTGHLFDFYTKRWQANGVLRFRQEIGDRFEVDYTGIWNTRWNVARGGDFFERSAITVTPSSPYYITGLGTGNESVVYNLSVNNPAIPIEQRNFESTYNHMVDFRANLAGDFRFTASGVYGETDGCAVCQPQQNTTIGASIAQTNPSAFNPYLSGPQGGSTVSGLVGGFIQYSTMKMGDLTGKVDGTLFTLPAGRLRVAAGTEYQKYDYFLHAQNTLDLQNAYQTSRLTSSSRTVGSGYAEFFVPVFGGDFTAPLIQRLDLDMAVRYDSYSDAGQTTNPKIGVTWRPHNDVQFRGSWGTAFRAPTLIEADPATVGQTNRIYISNGAGDPSLPITLTSTGQSAVLSRTGNTAGLKPESANVWSMGADYTPEAISGLKLSVTYYNVAYKDRIENLPNQNLVLSSPTYRSLYANYIIVAPQPTSCVNGNYATYNPKYLPFLNDKNAVFTPSTINDCTLTAIINGGRLNLGDVHQDGLDITANYSRDTAVGVFGGTVTVSKILDLQKSVVKGGPLFKALDTIGFQVSTRARADLTYQRGGFNADLGINYTGSYLNNAPITINGVLQPNSQAPAWTTLDLNLAYTWHEDAPNAALRGLRVGVSFQNLADAQPPIVLSGTTAIDVANANPFGRIMTFEVTKRF
jgi:iron complex outermembrane receptor protein